MKMLKFGRGLKSNFIQSRGLRRGFADIVPSKDQQSSPNIIVAKDMLSDISNMTSGLSAEDYLVTKKTGADLFLTPEKKRTLESPGFFFNDVNDAIDLEANSYKGWKLQYLKNMLLLQDYSNIFRDFLQSCALNDVEGLNLTCEPRFRQFLRANLNPIVNNGYNLEIDSLRILHNYKILGVEIFKNLKINRFENKEHTKYSYSSYPTPLGPLVVAHEQGNDHSIARDQKPFIFATTMLIRTPMKIAIFNQNLKKKLHGLPEDHLTDYVVRFESQFSYNDFFWILPTQNKPKRLRSTKIADFNNVLRGNPFFCNNFDLAGKDIRHNYMAKDDYADFNVISFLNSTNKI